MNNPETVNIGNKTHNEQRNTKQKHKETNNMAFF